MEKQKFRAILVLLVPQVIELIAECYEFDEITATKEFYASKVYSVLKREDTKVWHFSPLTLFNMFDEGKRTDIFVFPEET